MGQALIVCAIQTICELVTMTSECIAKRPKIPHRVIKATVDEFFWKGVIDEMFVDGRYTSTRLHVVDLYTKSTCDYLEQIERQETATRVRAAYEQWQDDIKTKV